jgi:chemotaxis protein methyltransferase CheR
MKLAGTGGIEISSANYSFLQSEVYKNSGIVLDETKHYLLEARLMPIVQRENLKTINDLCALMRATTRSSLLKDVTEAMTTNETLFFRDNAPFQVMREKLLPELMAQRKSTRTLKLWSAASSSGQEAYSLAMMLMEAGLQGWNIEILGTDLSERMVERSRAGKYLQIEVNRGLPAAYLLKYFQRQGLEWQIRDDLRRMVKFRQFDLRQPMSTLGPFDFVFCRNVLIYFDVETRRSILKRIEGTLHTGGCLVLGAAETMMNLSTAFERRVVDGTNFYVKKGL